MERKCTDTFKQFHVRGVKLQLLRQDLPTPDGIPLLTAPSSYARCHESRGGVEKVEQYSSLPVYPQRSFWCLRDKIILLPAIRVCG